MPVDPQIQALLDRGTGVPATHTLPVDVARAQYEARIALMASPAEIASIREQTIEGPGGPLRIRIYTPHGEGPFPLMVFFHGSGSCCAALIPMTGCAAICVPVRGASSRRSTIASRPRTSSRLRSASSMLRPRVADSFV
jgi:acetyl esterase